MSVFVRDFGAAVRRFRAASGWSQEQLAEYAGLNRSYVGEIERGSAIASIVTLDKLARAFNVPVERLLNHSPGDLGIATLAHSALVDPASVG
ncbi:helix-turn-helix domain-containing protein [Paraburkholderia sediminicola]|uniref:helix-turn-helix domain-containing protein n=1 Tax=Paraburkholderia sediminicola TaxID=458836 RepID=UPI0038B8ACEB